jgi:hypothetical protein
MTSIRRGQPDCSQPKIFLTFRSNVGGVSKVALSDEALVGGVKFF